MKTRLTTSSPWGLIHTKGTRLLCADGKIRSVSRISSTADTFFSIPCAIRVKGVNITGYATSQEEHAAPYRRAYSFRQHTDQQSKCDAVGIPSWPAHSYSPEMAALVAKAFSL